MAKSRGGSFLPVLVAFVAVAGFLGWLAMQKPPETVAVTEPTDTASAAETAEDAEAGPPTQVEAETLASSAGARGLMGQRIELGSVPVSTKMTDQLFWIELPGGSPYLVKLDDAAVAAGRSAPASGNVRIIGRILEKNAAVLDQWMESGVLTSQDQRDLAEFGTTYLEASRISPAGS